MTTILPATTVTAAVTLAGATQFQWKGHPGRATPSHLAAQFNFVYGSGGTTLDVYLQTSFDSGSTWTDIANFHVTTSSLRKLINLSATTPVTTSVTPTDGTMTANTAQDGLIGPIIRVKWGSSGTYAGGTTIQVDVTSDLHLAPYPGN